MLELFRHSHKGYLGVGDFRYRVTDSNLRTAHGGAIVTSIAWYARLQAFRVRGVASFSWHTAARGPDQRTGPLPASASAFRRSTAGEFFPGGSGEAEVAEPGRARKVNRTKNGAVKTGLVFNKTYHARARSGGLVSAGAILEELVERAADRPRKKRSSGNLQGGLQLELFSMTTPRR